jgi:hypothetical protein
MSEELDVTTEEAAETTAAETTTEATEKAFVDTMLDSMTDEETKGHKMWDNLKGKSADELGKYVRELKSFTGKKGDIPKEDASEDEWSAFYQKMGRPETMDGYDFTVGDEFKDLVGEEQAPFYEQAVDWFKDEAFKAGMSADKADGMVDRYLTMIADQQTAVNKVTSERVSASELTLKNEWKDDGEGIQQGIKAMLESKGGLSSERASGLVEMITKDPELAIAMGKVSAKFSDDIEIGGLHTKTTAGLQDQKMELETQMIDERAKYGNVRPETVQKWQATLVKLGDDL